MRINPFGDKMEPWNHQLRGKLQQIKNRTGRTPKIAILGIGSELNGDDAAGVFVIRQLIDRLHEQSKCSPNRCLFDCGTVPENFTGVLRQFMPDYVLMVDAGSFGEIPGSIAFTDFQDTDDLSFSTHSLPPSVFAGFLVKELSCELNLLLIQAENIEFCHPMDPGVTSAIEAITESLADLMSEF